MELIDLIIFKRRQEIFSFFVIPSQKILGWECNIFLNSWYMFILFADSAQNNNDTQGVKQENQQGQSSSQDDKSGTSSRGFASMDQKKAREIQKKGGEAVSRDREHMAEIGRKGGQTVSRDREHMAEIGRKGGESRGQKNKEKEKVNSS